MVESQVCVRAQVFSCGLALVFFVITSESQPTFVYTLPLAFSL